MAHPPSTQQPATSSPVTDTSVSDLPLSSGFDSGRVAALWEAIASIKAGDPFKPVWVVAPSRYATLAFRHALAGHVHGIHEVDASETGGFGGRKPQADLPIVHSWPMARCGFVEVYLVTFDELVASLARPELASRGVRLVDAQTQLETLRRATSSLGERFERFAAHDETLLAIREDWQIVARSRPQEVGRILQAGLRGQILADIVDRCRQILAGASMVDVSEALAAALRASADPAANRIPDVVFVGSPILGPVESDLVEALENSRRMVRLPGVTTPSQSLSIIECSDPDEEVRAVVDEIARGVVDGVPLWHWSVLHPPGLRYALMLHQQLDAAGIAWNGPYRQSLAQTPAGRSLVALLTLIGSALPRSGFVEWLAAHPLSDPFTGELVRSGEWTMICADAGVVAGPGQWDQRLATFAESVGSGRGELADQARRLRRFVLGLSDALASPPTGWRALVGWVTHLFDRYMVLPEGGVAGGPHTYDTETLAELRSVVAGLSALDDVSPDVDFVVFRRTLLRALEETDDASGDSPTFGHGTLVAPVTQAAGIPTTRVALVGMDDQTTPGDQARMRTNLLDERNLGELGWPERRERMTQLREAVVDSLTGRCACVATWARCDPRSAKSQTPSRWLEALEAGPVETGSGPVNQPIQLERVERPSFYASIASGGSHVSWEATLGYLTSLRLTESPVDPADDTMDPAGGGLAGRHLTGLADTPLAGLTDGHLIGLTTRWSAVLARRSSVLTRFDGWIGPGTWSAFDPARPMSATRLETYARCPRRYLFERVLHVSEPAAPEELDKIGSRDRGTLVHEVLERYVAERIEGAPQSLDRLLELADTRFDEAEQAGITGRPLLWSLEKAAMTRWLKRFHEEDCFEPVAVELRFGSGPDSQAPAVEVDVEVVSDVEDNGQLGSRPPRPAVERGELSVGDAGNARITFRGSVDRVDRIEIDGKARILVSDYKTGRQETLKALAEDPVAHGTLLQLPLYAMAAAALDSDTPVMARYWLLSDNRCAPSFSTEIGPAITDRFHEVITLIADGVSRGVFPATPGNQDYQGFENCMYCPFDTICPPDRSEQWERKCNAPQSQPVTFLQRGGVSGNLKGMVRQGPLSQVPS